MEGQAVRTARTLKLESRRAFAVAVRFASLFPRGGSLLLAALVLATADASAGAPPAAASDFLQGIEAYTSGAFDQAAALFRAVATREPSAGAYHNLGNAEWKRGQAGEAILAWEQAQWLNPFGANTRANLRFARQKAQLPSPSLSWYEICSTWLPGGAWAVLAAASLWLAVALVLLPGIFRWRKADWHHALAAASLAVFLLTIPALVGIQTRGRLGVIRSKDTPLRLTPTREAQVLGKLAAGEFARLERQRGDYVYVRTGNDAAGWVESAQFGRMAAP
jgi:tetratricopeptide (TPR) repeat protein